MHCVFQSNHVPHNSTLHTHPTLSFSRFINVDQFADVHYLSPWLLPLQIPMAYILPQLPYIDDLAALLSCNYLFAGYEWNISNHAWRSRQC